MHCWIMFLGPVLCDGRIEVWVCVGGSGGVSPGSPAVGGMSLGDTAGASDATGATSGVAAGAGGVGGGSGGGAEVHGGAVSGGASGNNGGGSWVADNFLEETEESVVDGADGEERLEERRGEWQSRSGDRCEG